MEHFGLTQGTRPNVTQQKLRLPPVPRQSFVDTPGFDYANWRTNTASVGMVQGAPQVAVIGAGISGLTAGLELVRSGCRVDLFEATGRIGGRLYSAKGSPNWSRDVFELGAMRFPPTEFLLDQYLQEILGLKLTDLPLFPDPGVLKTFICYKNEQPQIWEGANSPFPAGFGKVHTGWRSLMQKGVTSIRSGQQVLTAPLKIRRILQQAAFARQAGLTDQAAHWEMRARQAWQTWLDTFSTTSLVEGLYRIFARHGSSDNWAVPGQSIWTFEDVGRFAELGIGSGGFGPIFPASFLEIIRLVINGLVDSQRQMPCGIEELAKGLAARFEAEGGHLFLNTPVCSIEPTERGSVRLESQFKGPLNDGAPYQRVVLATTTRAMELGTNVTSYFPAGAAQIGKPVLQADVAEAVKTVQVIPSNKIAVRIRKFWKDNPDAPRVLLTDSAVKQIYTLDYGEDDTAVCFLSYTWLADAVKLQAVGKCAGEISLKKQAVETMLGVLQTQMGPEVAAWSENLRPLNDDFDENVACICWQDEPFQHGAFKLSPPGQDPYMQRLFFDYQKAGTERDSGVYLAGDCIDWSSGWIEAGLRTALNAATAVVHSLGGSVHTADGQSPMTIDADAFDYGGSGRRGARLHAAE
ncbi:tryptophan 2-monooxygenase precursor [Roseibium hamelinense]|uniref:Tryptophan 2-monooxygenase n=1 Tax=Roseibium hamelinense TaxID=150831 RepID=A0A562TAH3_9HYPH|nr:NAD(P)/FAD-dependent oxidoreductase [Roseibium hamelinense]TWI90148.1 tryptophan 2-monooxygenase precursor [Roseibium hamelinense]